MGSWGSRMPGRAGRARGLSAAGLDLSAASRARMLRRGLRGPRRSGRVRALALAVGLVVAMPLLVAAMPPPVYTGPIWSPFPLAATAAVPGQPLTAASAATARAQARSAAVTRNIRKRAGVQAHGYRRPARSAWPAPGSAVVALAGAQVGHGDKSAAAPRAAEPAGKLPVAVGAVAGHPGPSSVRVTLASHPAAARAGIHGVIMTVARRPGAGGAGGVIALRLHYSSFARDYGGAWASRLRIVELPACALSAPSLAVCREEVPLKSANNPVSGTLSAHVRFPAGPARRACGRLRPDPARGRRRSSPHPRCPRRSCSRPHRARPAIRGITRRPR